MKKKIIKYLCRLEGFKTAIKNAHFSASNMSEHKLFDDIAETIAENQDEIGEICQGIYGQFGKNTIKATPCKFGSSKNFIQLVINDTNSFYKTIPGEKYIGMRSVVEAFLGNLNKYSYLLSLCLKEDFKREFAKQINESTVVDDDCLQDAIEALEMSDGQIDFYEWSDAYRDEDLDYLQQTWNKACDITDYKQLRESKNMDKNKSFRLTEQEFHTCLNEAIGTVITKFMNEMNCKKPTKHINEDFDNDIIKGGLYKDSELDYTHFAVNKVTNLIVNGWGYAGELKEDVKNYKRDYFFVDLKDNGFNPKAYKILTFKACTQKGIDPNDDSVWSNTGLYPVAEECKMQKEGQNPFEVAHTEHPDWFIEN